MREFSKSYKFVIAFIFILNLLACPLLMSSTPFLQEASAHTRGFEVDIFEENLTIQPNDLGTIDLNLQEGKKIEVVFTLQVKEVLPVDVWFLNEDHYLLLVNGAQFLFFIDGSEQEVTYTRKIVTLTEHDVYKLVIANYNNQTVEANIDYEIRTYYADSEDLPFFLYPLLLAVIILVVLVIVLLFKARNYKQIISNISKKPSVKKGKRRKPKKAKPKVSKKATLKKVETNRPKYLEPKATAKKPSEKPEGVVSKQAEPKVLENVTSKFCGFCGKPVTTPFCTNCGRKV